MRILALVAARGGSKRLPGKNLLPLGGRPLILWSIDAAQEVDEICDVLVSTDDADIAATARTAGALVPWLRPAALATDSAGSVEVCIHALDWYESERGAVDGLLLLQPTSPFRSRERLRHGIDMFRSGADRSVIGVRPAATHPAWCFREEGGYLRPFVDGLGLQVRSQDLPPAYAVNGAFYLVAPRELRGRRSFYSEQPLPLLMERPEESIDIDTEWDLWLAQAVVAAGRGRLT